MNDTAELGQQSFVLMRLGDRQFALPAERVAELVPAGRVFRFPHRTPELEGVLVHRGRVTPVCNVSQILVGQRLADRRLYLLVLREYGNTMESVALPASGECELITAEMNPSSGEHVPHAKGWISHGGSVIEVLGLDFLIPGPDAGPRAAQELMQQEAVL